MKAISPRTFETWALFGHGGTGKTQLGVVVTLHRGDDAALGESCGRKPPRTDWDEEEIGRKLSIQTGLAYAEWPCTLCSGGKW